MGRAKATIDWKIANLMLKRHCEGTEVAAALGMHEDTFYKAVERKYKMGFTAYKQIKRAEGKAILRVLQFQGAEDGDKTMLIWLGKNILGQSDRQDIKTEVSLINWNIQAVKKNGNK